jgi:DNA-binding NtrC family response regulator
MPAKDDAPPVPLPETRSVVLEGAESLEEDLCLLVSCAGAVDVVALPRGATLVAGRDPAADVHVQDASVSRRHAQIRVGAHVMVTDLESRNGTRVGGDRLKPGTEVALPIGESFELGAVTLVLQRARGFVDPQTGRLPRASRARAQDAAARAGVIVEDDAMKRLYALLDVVAQSRLTVLVLGETGVGKEVFAESVHRASKRADKPFLQINCAALPESLLEGELFGYEKGAFTGATQAKPGLFESADGGTVFLDEIGEVPLSTQAKLLRVLESGEVLRLGSVKPHRVNVRFVSATNRDPRGLVGEGRFRSDLYFRLNGISLTIPPLRQRVAEIVPLATMFMRRTAEENDTPPPRMSDATRVALAKYPWPGNIRELRNVMERAVVTCTTRVLEPAHLMLEDRPLEGLIPDTVPPPSSATATVESERRIPAAPPPSASSFPAGLDVTSPIASLGAQLEALEKQSIIDALNKTGGNQSRAAKMLGITRRVLIYRIQQYGLARPRKA